MRYVDNSNRKTAIKQSLIDINGEICHYCGEPTPPQLATIDHIYPQSRNGSHHIENLAYCCKSCNSIKRNLSLEEFRLVMSVRVSKYGGVISTTQYKKLTEMGALQPLKKLYSFNFEEVKQ